jgi:hypothetical protein
MAETRITNQDTYQGVYPTVFKKIDQSDISINPFQAYKTWNIISGSSTGSMLPLIGIYSNINNLPALGTNLTYNDAVNIDGTLQTISYFSINHLFYKNKKEPSKTYGPTNLNLTKKYLFQSASILSIPQIKIGEGIKPRSFTLTGSSVSLASDLYGNVYDTVYNTSNYINYYISALVNTIQSRGIAASATTVVESVSCLEAFLNSINQIDSSSYDDSFSFVNGYTYYEGFNEYFDTTRIQYESQGVIYEPGVKTSNGSQAAIGYAAKFSGAGYIKDSLPGYYDRDHDYAISFFVSSSNSGTSNGLLIAKASSSLQPTYPFKIELSGSKQIVFSAAGSTEFKTQITSSIFVSSAWNHIVCQKSGSWLQMYVNGTLHSSTSNNLLVNTFSPFTASARIDNTSDLYIGGFNSQSSNVNAYIDEVRIFNKSLTSANISSLNNRIEGGTLLQTNVVGTVFDKQGLVVISSPDYRYHNILTTPFTSSYKSTVTIHEMNVVTRMDSGDFNMSTNLTLTRDDDSTYLPFVSSSTFAPYITTIGLYDSAGQLLAIGKLAQPIRKRNDVDMNFLIRIDLDKNITKGD